MADLNALQIVWPGISTLLGAGVGGGVTLWANKQKSNEDRASALSARQREIQDRSFNTCADVLKTGQLYYNEVNSLWWDLQCGEPKDVILAHSSAFDEALRNHHAANAVFRVAMPPTVETAFLDYIKSVRNLADVVSDWQADYLAGSSSFDPGDKPTPQERYQELSNDMVATRDRFAKTARALFVQGVWPDAN